MLIAAILTSTAPLFASNLPGADPAPLAWPLHIVDSDRHPAGRSPMLVVGGLFTGGHCYREDDMTRVHVTPAGQIAMPCRGVPNKYSHAMAEYLLGNIRPRPTCNEEETCVFLTSPPLDNGFHFTVDDVVYDQGLWTVTASYWYDDIPHQWSPGANREGQMLRLGWLPAGDYTCRLVLNHRFMSKDAPRPGIYTNTQRLSTDVNFTVTKSDPWKFHPWDQEPSKAIIRDTDLRPLRFQAELPAQPLYFAFRRTDKPAYTTPTLAWTPALDWRKYSQAADSLWAAPVDKPADDSVLVARFSGGEAQALGKYDYAEIASLRWETSGDNLTLHAHARVWRKPMNDGTPPQRLIPEFAAPVPTKGLAGTPDEIAKRITVKVTWSEATDQSSTPYPELPKPLAQR